MLPHPQSVRFFLLKVCGGGGFPFLTIAKCFLIGSQSGELYKKKLNFVELSIFKYNQISDL